MGASILNANFMHPKGYYTLKQHLPIRFDTKYHLRPPTLYRSILVSEWDSDSPMPQRTLLNNSLKRIKNALKTVSAGWISTWNNFSSPGPSPGPLSDDILGDDHSGRRGGDFR